MTLTRLSGLALVSTAALFTACSSTPSRFHDEPLTQVRPAEGQYGRVRAIDVVSSSARSSGAGTVLGAIIGAAVGNQIGSGTGRTAATGAGAIGGALIGNRIAKNRADDVYRVNVRFDNGNVADLEFEDIADLRVGDRVLYDGRNLRLV